MKMRAADGAAQELNHDGSEYAFTDDEFLGRWVSCCVSALPPAPLFDDSDADLLAI
jgi:mannitol operon repressor